MSDKSHEKILSAFRKGSEAKKSGKPCVVPKNFDKDQKKAWKNGWQSG